MKEIKAKMKQDVEFHKYEIVDAASMNIKEKFRTVKIGEIVKCIIYPTQNYFLTTPYYDAITEDGFNCKVNVDCVELLNAP